MRNAQPARLGERLLSILFPCRCLLCGKLIPAGDPFCGGCREKTRQAPIRREISLPDGQELPVISVFPYEGGFRRNLHHYKFYDQRTLSKPIGRLMAETIKAHGPTLHCIAYAPLYWRDLWKRDYDQSYLLARVVAEELRLPLADILTKTRRTKAQHDLTREERMANPRGAYRASGDLGGKSVLLIDDIVTTGTTIAECAQALYKAGASSVYGLCAADAGTNQNERD